MRNNFAVFVCGNCKVPLPLPPPAPGPDSAGALAKVRHPRQDAVATCEDAAKDDVISPHQKDSTREIIAPGTYFERPGMLPRQNSVPPVGRKRSREN